MKTAKMLIEAMSALTDTINTSIQLYLKERNILPRPNASSGAWLSLLLPIAVVWGALKHPDSSSQYQKLGVFSVGLLASTIIFVSKTIKSSKSTFTKSNYVIYIAPAIITGTLLFRICGSGILFSIFGGLFAVCSYYFGILKLLTNCPKCLTFGEASVVIQAAILFSFSIILNSYDAWLLNYDQCMNISTIILQVGFVGIGLICGSVYFFPKLRSTLNFYRLIIAVLLGVVLPILHILLQQSPVLWILFLVTEVQRVGLVSYWVVCSGIAVYAVVSQISEQRKASTIVRKYFHLLAIAVYIPGLIRDCCFLYLASGIILALFIMLEVLRMLRMPPIGDMLQDGFSVFADDKDQGAMALTPIYLLAGCSLPLWLHPIATSDQHLLVLLSGILSIGVGDTAASVCGTWFGRHRWSSGTMKTVEGTAGCVSSQLSVVLILTYLCYLECTWIMFLKSTVGIVVASLVEAKTDQIDNLALPLVMYIFLL